MIVDKIPGEEQAPVQLFGGGFLPGGQSSQMRQALALLLAQSQG
jgi:hypothetical protein